MAGFKYSPKCINQAQGIFSVLSINSSVTTKDKQDGLRMSLWIVTFNVDQRSQTNKSDKPPCFLSRFERIFNKLIRQCRNCHRFRPVALNCHLQYRCIKCDDLHSPDKCSKTPDVKFLATPVFLPNSHTSLEVTIASIETTFGFIYIVSPYCSNQLLTRSTSLPSDPTAQTNSAQLAIHNLWEWSGSKAASHNDILPQKISLVLKKQNSHEINPSIVFLKFTRFSQPDLRRVKTKSKPILTKSKLWS